jgi:hypothetical protein
MYPNDLIDYIENNFIIFSGVQPPLTKEVDVYYD